MDKIQYVGLMEPNEVKALKSEHKEVHQIEVKVSEKEVSVCYIRKPDRNVTARALSLYHQDKPLQSGEFIRDNCWLGGDPRAKAQDDIAISVALQCNNLVPIMETEVKKL